MGDIMKVLNFTVSSEDLQNYYSTLTERYQHLNWNWNQHGDSIVPQWRDAVYQDPANLLTHGWAIQSNLVDLTIPCPPWNISILPTTEYRNTELAFGIIERLQEAIPYAYRWAISVQPPGGKVSVHSDQEDEYTVWIPIKSPDSDAITFIIDDEEGFKLPADGHAYLLDTTFPHYTNNLGSDDRVTIIFRLNKCHYTDILAVTGLI